MTTLFPNYTQFTSTQELAENLSKVESELLATTSEEAELEAELKKIREKKANLAKYAGKAKRYTMAWIETTGDPKARFKLQQQANELYLKEYQLEEYKRINDKRDVAEKVEMAARFALAPGFNPNTWKASMIRGDLEKQYARTMELPIDSEVEQIQAKIIELRRTYAPKVNSQLSTSTQKEPTKEDIEEAVNTGVFAALKMINERVQGRQGEIITFPDNVSTGIDKL